MEITSTIGLIHLKYFSLSKNLAAMFILSKWVGVTYSLCNKVTLCCILYTLLIVCVYLLCVIVLLCDSEVYD